MNQIFISLLAIFILNSCSGGGAPAAEPNPSGQDGALVSPTDSNALSAVLIMPAGAQVSTGTPPSPTTSPSAPIVNNRSSTITTSNGSTAPLNFQYENISTNLGGCYVQVEGADDFYTIPYTSTSDTSGDLQLPIGIPTNVDEGEFSVNFCVYDTDNNVSNIIRTTATVLKLGTGSVQISLSWNTASDQDLHVTDPSGELIYYSDQNSASGGELDRDDTDGYGPENIFWKETAPDGTYKVEVHDFSSSTPNLCYITISAGGVSRSFNITTEGGNKLEVATFTKSGTSITFN